MRKGSSRTPSHSQDPNRGIRKPINVSFVTRKDISRENVLIERKDSGIRIKKMLVLRLILCNIRYEFRGQYFELKVTRGLIIFLREVKRNRIYFLKGVIEKPMAAVADEEAWRV